MSGMLTTFYNTVMKRNTVYVSFVIVGALAGEHLVSTTFDKLWESNNQGKLYKHLEGNVIGGTKDE
eukprot:CAMPEP_0196574262 /NCGR_PEP_ID=MMETSP1081-20130531/4011_1 /TAXON_ID=36882 /ORGANISM="Pyramimonas amylifera, Strain CCMP720" /LENGTH=65 /DNA_ID=CAMNT_0041892227 /DNA_START=75 /DNA_END=272 /DNA_ORIENTATION=-